MENYQKYIPLLIAAGVIGAVAFGSYSTLTPLVEKKNSMEASYEKIQSDLKKAETSLININKKLQQMKTTSVETSKKIYYPTEADLDKESLFFTLYTDIIDVAKQNNIKIRSIDYNYYPKNDPFVTEGGRENYFVCDLDMKLVSNYKELRNFVEALFQYPYYVKFNNLSVQPYKTDKKILLSDFSIRLYAHTDIEKPLDNVELN